MTDARIKHIMTPPRTTRYTRRRRGTVLLLAIGLVTIVAILGSTFLVMSLLDAGQAEALATKAQAEPLARGAVERVRAALARDLHADEQGPYGRLERTGWEAREDWTGYIDYPSDEVDRHLSDGWRPEIDNGGETWRHLTNLFGASASLVTDINPNTIGPDDPYVDTDGDGVKDALLHSTGITDARGNEYYVAVRVTDMASRIHIPSTNPPPPPADTLMDHSYGIGDEMWLHWHGPDSPVNTGLLYERLDDEAEWDTDDRQDRGMLTTSNVSRPLLRHPELNDGRAEYQKIPLTGTDSLDDQEVRERLYTHLREAAGAGDDDDEGRRQVAHFVANLWAYMSDSAPQDEAFAFDYGDADGGLADQEVVFGLTEQLVITEAYAYYWEARDEEDDLIGRGEAYAVELMNPTEQGIHTGQYRFGDIDGDGEDFPSVTISEGERVVIYAVDGEIPGETADDPQNADRTDFDFLAGQVGDTFWHDASGSIAALRLDDDGQIDIWRDVGGERIPVDSISAEDIDFYPPPPGIGDEVCRIRGGARDDHWGRRRMTVAWDPVIHLEHDSDSEANRKDHRLGEEAELTASQMADVGWDNIYEGFYIDRRNYAHYVDNAQAALDSLGEISAVHLVGPARVDGEYESFPHRLRNHSASPARGRADFLGAVNTDAEGYPDIPWACLVQEFVELGPPGLSPPMLLERDEDDRRWKIAGRINVNTAPQYLLETTWLWGNDEIPGTNLTLTPEDREQLAEQIVAYRENPDARVTADYGPELDGLRNLPESSVPGFLSPGEVAIPVLRYADWYLDREGVSAEDPQYHEAREWFYRRISNRITVNSDAYAVNIVVQLQGRDDYENPVDRWNYIAIIDRSTTYGPNGMPAVRLFAEIK